MAACTQQEFGGGHSEREREAKRYVGGGRNRESWKERGLVGVGDMYIYMHT